MDALEFHPLTTARWPDLVSLFGERGACGGCWCMAWRLKNSEFQRKKGALNKKAFRAIVDSGEPPGVLAYAGGRPVGWCAIAPRERFVRLQGSRVLKPVDDQPVWSVVCFFIARPWRRKGLSRALLEGAVEFARSRGARIVEGYPVETSKDMPDVFVWTGLAPAFRAAGFTEAARRSASRPIFRRVLAE